MNYNDYYKNHWWYKYWDYNEFTNIHKYLKSNFWLILWNLKDKNILDIWCWLWTFTSFCYMNGVQNYTWIDLDNYSINFSKEKYPNYNFIHWDILNNKDILNKYDIIFLSHVFEHIDLKDAEILSELIFRLLNKWWYWLNIMPNAWFIFSNYFRYWDITHKILYTDNSFNQILLKSWFNIENILHRNDILWQGFIKRIALNYIWKFFYKIFILLIYPDIRIYTPTIISIIKK